MSDYLLKKIPADVFKFVQQEQNRIKAQRGILQYSLSETIYKMLRDYKKCKELNNFKSDE